MSADKREDLILTVREQCLPVIERTLVRFLEEQSKRGIAWNAEMSRYQLATGGKRLRALVPCFVYAACGKDPLQAVQLGAAIEIVHNATLVHDDLQDGDEVRRGMPTVWKKYSAPQSVNCGDAMLYFGQQMMLEMPLDPSLLRTMSLRFTRAVIEVIEGQAQEFLFKDEPLPGISRYLQVVSGKTAALLASAFALSVESLGKSASLCREVESAGMDLGILFQMQDDLLDVYGEKGRERRATDIAEGKISILIAELVQSASAEDRERALAILRKPREETQDSEIDEVIRLFEKYRTKDAVLSRIREIRDRIAKLSWKDQEPRLHGLMVEMGELFLEPIQGLLRT